MESAIIAAGAVLYYLEFTEHRDTKHITAITRIDEDRYVARQIHPAQSRNIRLVLARRLLAGRHNRPHLHPYMGGRLLRRRLSLPLIDRRRIEKRLDMTEAFATEADTCTAAASLLKGMGDMERLISKVAVGRVSPRELVALKNGFCAIAELKSCFPHRPTSS